jgi:hypothetical protein
MSLIKLAARGDVLFRNGVLAATKEAGTPGVNAASRILRYLPKFKDSNNLKVIKDVDNIGNAVDKYVKNVKISDTSSMSNFRKAVAKNPKLGKLL